MGQLGYLRSIGKKSAAVSVSIGFAVGVMLFYPRAFATEPHEPGMQLPDPVSFPAQQLAALENSQSTVGDPEHSTPYAAGGNLAVVAPAESLSQARTQPADIELHFSRSGHPVLSDLPKLTRREGDRFYAFDQRGNRVYFTIDPGLQQRSEEILRTYKTNYGALVAVVPETGRILSVASHSTLRPDYQVATQATFPAASMFKVITSAAAVEHAGMSGSDLVRFSGGNYTLERYNYLPDARKDKRFMSLSEALGKSVNPVFARVALTKVPSRILRHYAETFGFNSDLQHDFPVERSSYSVGFDDYSYARTAAGFGSVFVSPMHAAMMAAAVANHGTMMRPYLVENVIDRNGREIYRARPTVLSQAVLPSTAAEVTQMMESTVTNGTSRRAFQNTRFGGVAGKTGTLSGTNPKGMYFWFMGAAPSHQPEIAVSALVVNSGYAAIRGSNAARHLMEYYFHRRFGLAVPELRSSPAVKARKGKSAGRKASKKKRSGGASSSVKKKKFVKKNTAKSSKSSATKKVRKKRSTK